MISSLVRRPLLGLMAAVTSLVLGWASVRAAEPIRVLAAFTLKSALDAVAENYRAAGGTVTLVYGPSPTLAKQVESGLSADIFFSADPAWTDELAQRKLIRAESIAELVGNDLVLVARKGAGPTVKIDRHLALAKLIGAGPVAMCDPAGHPAGDMAKASLVALGLWSSIEKKIAITENPLAAVNLVGHGDAPFAIVFTTDALTDPGVEIVGTFPADSHPPIRYPAAILAKTDNPDSAKFFDYLKSAASTAVFKRFGYVTLGMQRP